MATSRPGLHKSQTDLGISSGRNLGGPDGATMDIDYADTQREFRLKVQALANFLAPSTARRYWR